MLGYGVEPLIRGCGCAVGVLLQDHHYLGVAYTQHTCVAAHPHTAVAVDVTNQA